MKKYNTAKDNIRIKYGEPVAKSYGIWQDMWNRCRNKNRKVYYRYGGRGIKVCDRWKEFWDFFSDMGICPPGQSLDRINNDGDYEPSNCKWSSQEEQCNNTRRNRFYTKDGETKTLTQWCNLLNLNYWKIRSRLDSGWTFEDSIK